MRSNRDSKIWVPYAALIGNAERVITVVGLSDGRVDLKIGGKRVWQYPNSAQPLNLLRTRYLDCDSEYDLELLAVYKLMRSNREFLGVGMKRRETVMAGNMGNIGIGRWA